MSLRLLLFGLLCLPTSLALAQDDTEPKGQPNLPGTLRIDLGLGLLVNGPEEFGAQVIGSNAFSIGYQYDIQLFDSKFFFSPGLAYANERFKLADQRYFAYEVADNNTLVSAIPGVVDNENPDAYITNKNKLITQYLDIPLELQFRTNKLNVNRSFTLAVGAKIGVLLQSSLKSKGLEAGREFKVRENGDYGLLPFRYGVYLRTGYGRFQAFFYYSLSDVIDSNVLQPELNTDGNFTGSFFPASSSQANPFIFGLSFPIF